MRTIKDKRRLIVFKISSIKGELEEEKLTEIYQFDNNVETTLIFNPNVKSTLFVEEEAELLLQASEMFVSPLEWLRIRLARSPNFRVETTT
jgi:hypothetical protein